jgi:hypothetical protein
MTHTASRHGELTMQTHNLRARHDWAALATMALFSCFGAAIAAPEGVRPGEVFVRKTVNYRQTDDGDVVLVPKNLPRSTAMAHRTAAHRRAARAMIRAKRVVRSDRTTRDRD